MDFGLVSFVLILPKQKKPIQKKTCLLAGRATHWFVILILILIRRFIILIIRYPQTDKDYFN
jgi:hypothetical protein